MDTINKVYILDSCNELFNELHGLQCELAPYADDIACTDGFLLINAETCGFRYAYSPLGVGVYLPSGDISKLCEMLLYNATHVFGSSDSVRLFLSNGNAWDSSYFTDIINIASTYLRYIGMNESLCGFSYIAFLVAYLTFAKRASLKYDIFPVMELHFNKSIQCMERAMRYAIESTWNKGDIFAQETLFGYTVSPERGKPVALELAAMLSERIRDELIRA